MFYVIRYKLHAIIPVKTAPIQVNQTLKNRKNKPGILAVF
jgi:hypothetical protein